MKTENQIGTAFLIETSKRLDKSIRRIDHCLDQLNDQEVWWRPKARMNSIGNLILHINGNLTQWVLHGLGGQKDLRNRPSEFESRQTNTKQNFKKLLTDLKDQINKILTDFDSTKLLDEKKIQGFNVLLLNGIYSTMTHLEGHTGQIVYITQIIKGDEYKLFWQPQTDEQESKNI